MNIVKIWKTSAVMVLLAIAASACGDEAGSPGTNAPPTGPSQPTTEATTVPQTTDMPGLEPPSAAPPVDCRPNACRVFGVRFAATMTIDEVRSLARNSDAAVVALWRAHAICVAGVGSPPGVPAEPFREPSSFAYVDADVIRAVQDQGPPATDGGWSLATRERFVEEWTAASEPGVLFTGAALLTRGELIAGADVADQRSLDWYLTDQTDVLYLRGHADQLAPMFDPPEGAC